MAIEITGAYRFLTPRPDWLARRREPILEPELPILDAHHHIWEQEGNPYRLDDLAADLATGHRIVGTVYVQAHYAYRDHGPEALRCVGETERVEALAGEAARRGLAGVCAGIVAFADLMLGARVAEVLDAHRAASPGRFRGVRHLVSRDPEFPDGIIMRPAPAGLLGEPAYREGLRTLAAHGLTYDAMLYHRQIPELAAAADAAPDLPIVLDHLGTVLGVGSFAARRRETFEAWRADIRELARRPRVSVKLGGLGMVVCGGSWHERPEPPSSAELAEDWRPYVEACLEAFGPERCMFESNFPVDKGMFGYDVLWNAFKRLAAGASAAEKAALFHDTARRFYRLDL